MRSRTTAYLLASLIAAAGIAVALWLDNMTGNTLFMSMLLAVVVAVWLFGPGPGWVRSSSPASPARSWWSRRADTWYSTRPAGSSSGHTCSSAAVVVVLGWALARARRITAGAVSQSEDQRRRFASALDAMPNGLIVVDSVGRIILANSKATDILGSAIEGTDLLTDPRFMTGHTTDGQRTTVEESALLRSLRGDEVVQGEEIEVRRSDGSHRVIRTSSAPYYTGSGAVGGAVVVFADITTRRAADYQSRLASEVAVILDRTLEVEEGLLAVASLMVPGNADYCVIAMADPPRVVAVRHEDPDRQAVAEKLVALWPVTPDLPGTMYHVMETGLGHMRARRSPRRVPGGGPFSRRQRTGRPGRRDPPPVAADRSDARPR